jgi:hypothetical protein
MALLSACPTRPGPFFAVNFIDNHPDKKFRVKWECVFGDFTKEGRWEKEPLARLNKKGLKRTTGKRGDS